MYHFCAHRDMYAMYHYLFVVTAIRTLCTIVCCAYRDPCAVYHLLCAWSEPKWSVQPALLMPRLPWLPINQIKQCQ